MQKYTFKKEIGKGSFGTVYESIRKATLETFAIKKVRCDAPENVELALQEFWTLSCLQKHLNIIRFEECYLQHADSIKLMKHGDVSSSGYLHLIEMSIKGECHVSARNGSYHLWFVMEYCDKGDLNEYILSRPPISTLNTSFMLQLADGICFLHKNNVVHRDLKPENILVQTDPNPTKKMDSIPILKIADFGLSKVCLANESSNRVNVNNCWLSSACGSDFFMAPEVFEERYTAKADVFALGIIIWAIMDRITFIDASTKKVLLGTYVRQETKVLSVGEALLDDPKLDILELLHETSLRKPVALIEESKKTRTTKSRSNHSCTCVDGDPSQLRKLVALMVHVNSDRRPNSEELLVELRKVLTSPKSRAKFPRRAQKSSSSRQRKGKIPDGTTRGLFGTLEEKLSRTSQKTITGDGIHSPPRITRPPSLPVAIIRSKRKSAARRHVHRVVSSELTKDEDVGAPKSSCGSRQSSGGDPQLASTSTDVDSVAATSECAKNTTQPDQAAPLMDDNVIDSIPIKKYSRVPQKKMAAQNTKKDAANKPRTPRSIRKRKQTIGKKSRNLRSNFNERRKSLRSFHDTCELISTKTRKVKSLASPSGSSGLKSLPEGGDRTMLGRSSSNSVKNVAATQCKDFVVCLSPQLPKEYSAFSSLLNFDGDVSASTTSPRTTARVETRSPRELFPVATGSSSLNQSDAASTTEQPMTSTDSTTELPMTSTDSTTEQPMTSTDSTTEQPMTSTDSTTEQLMTSTDSTTEQPMTSTDSTTEQPMTSTDSTTELPMTSTDSTTELPMTSTDSTTDQPITSTHAVAVSSAIVSQKHCSKQLPGDELISIAEICEDSFRVSEEAYSNESRLPLSTTDDIAGSTAGACNPLVIDNNLKSSSSTSSTAYPSTSLLVGDHATICSQDPTISTHLLAHQEPPHFTPSTPSSPLPPISSLQPPIASRESTTPLRKPFTSCAPTILSPKPTIVSQAPIPSPVRTTLQRSSNFSSTTYRQPVDSGKVLRILSPETHSSLFRETPASTALYQSDISTANVSYWSNSTSRGRAELQSTSSTNSFYCQRDCASGFTSPASVINVVLPASVGRTASSTTKSQEQLSFAINNILNSTSSSDSKYSKKRYKDKSSMVATPPRTHQPSSNAPHFYYNPNSLENIVAMRRLPQEGAQMSVSASTFLTSDFSDCISATGDGKKYNEHSSQEYHGNPALKFDVITNNPSHPVSNRRHFCSPIVSKKEESSDVVSSTPLNLSVASGREEEYEPLSTTRQSSSYFHGSEEPENTTTVSTNVASTIRNTTSSSSFLSIPSHDRIDNPAVYAPNDSRHLSLESTMNLRMVSSNHKAWSGSSVSSYQPRFIGVRQGLRNVSKSSVNVAQHVHNTSADNVPQHVHNTSVDNVPQHVHNTSADNVPQHVHNTSADNVPQHVHNTSADNVPQHVHNTSADNVPQHVHNTSVDNVPQHVHNTSADNVPQHVHKTDRNKSTRLSVAEQTMIGKQLPSNYASLIKQRKPLYGRDVIKHRAASTVSLPFASQLPSHVINQSLTHRNELLGTAVAGGNPSLIPTHPLLRPPTVTCPTVNRQPQYPAIAAQTNLLASFTPKSEGESRRPRKQLPVNRQNPFYLQGTGSGGSYDCDITQPLRTTTSGRYCFNQLPSTHSSGRNVVNQLHTTTSNGSFVFNKPLTSTSRNECIRYPLPTVASSMKVSSEIQMSPTARRSMESVGVSRSIRMSRPFTDPNTMHHAITNSSPHKSNHRPLFPTHPFIHGSLLPAAPQMGVGFTEPPSVETAISCGIQSSVPSNPLLPPCDRNTPSQYCVTGSPSSCVINGSYQQHHEIKSLNHLTIASYGSKTPESNLRLPHSNGNALKKHGSAVSKQKLTTSNLSGSSRTQFATRLKHSSPVTTRNHILHPASDVPSASDVPFVYDRSINNEHRKWSYVDNPLLSYSANTPTNFQTLSSTGRSIMPPVVEAPLDVHRVPFLSTLKRCSVSTLSASAQTSPNVSSPSKFASSSRRHHATPVQPAASVLASTSFHQSVHSDSPLRSTSHKRKMVDPMLCSSTSSKRARYDPAILPITPSFHPTVPSSPHSSSHPCLIPNQRSGVELSGVKHSVSTYPLYQNLILSPSKSMRPTDAPAANQPGLGGSFYPPNLAFDSLQKSPLLRNNSSFSHESSAAGTLRERHIHPDTTPIDPCLLQHSYVLPPSNLVARP